MDSDREKERLITNSALMHATCDFLDEQAGKGNEKTFEALKRSLDVGR